MAKEYNEEICKLTHKQIEDEQKSQRECMQRLTVIAEGQEKRVVAAEQTLAVVLERQKSVEERQKSIETNVDELRQKPAKAMSQISVAVIISVVCTIIGILMGKAIPT